MVYVDGPQVGPSVSIACELVVQKWLMSLLYFGLAIDIRIFGEWLTVPTAPVQ